MNDYNYDDIVASDEKTCVACPTQWEGTLNDGRKFYFRYRWGRAYLGVASEFWDAVRGDNDAVTAHKGIGDGYDGHLDDFEYRKVFVDLYKELE